MAFWIGPPSDFGSLVPAESLFSDLFNLPPPEGQNSSDIDQIVRNHAQSNPSFHAVVAAIATAIQTVSSFEHTDPTCFQFVTIRDTMAGNASHRSAQDEFVDLSRAAQLSGYSKRQLYEFVRIGLLVAYQPSRGKLLVELSELQHFLKRIRYLPKKQ